MSLNLVQKLQCLCLLQPPLINEVKHVFLIICVPAWCVLLVGSTKVALIRWWMSDNDEMYSVICCVVSTTTGLVCLVLSCVAEMKAEMKAWKSIVPLIGECAGVVNTALLVHSLLTTWTNGANWSESNNEDIVHRIGAEYDRLQFFHCYSLMFLGGFSYSLFWGVYQALQLYSEVQSSQYSQVKASIALCVVKWTLFVTAFNHVFTRHYEVVEYVPHWQLWLRGMCVAAAVWYTAVSVHIALGWQGHKHTVTCGSMLMMCVVFLVMRGFTHPMRDTALDLIELQNFSIFLVTVASIVSIVWVAVQSLVTIIKRDSSSVA